jgi:hypothetical protein
MSNNYSILNKKINLITHLIENKFIKFSSIHKNYSLETNTSNEICHFVGNSSVVLRLKDNTENYFALKILLDDTLMQNYKLISECQVRGTSTYIPNVTLLENEVEVLNLNEDAKLYHAILLPWENGITLKEKILHLTSVEDKEGLRELYTIFCNFSKKIKQQQLVHGDITDVNILCTDDNQLKLIDFDYCKSEELYFVNDEMHINRNFAHPKFKEYIFNPNADDFSLLIIATSIYAYSINPVLYNQLYSENGLLFTNRDFSNPENSIVFNYLEDIKDPFLALLLIQIKISLVNETPVIKNLTSLLTIQEKYIANSIIVKEKEYLLSSIESKTEHLEILQTKYHQQVILNTDKEEKVEQVSEEKLSIVKQMQNIKKTNVFYKYVGSFFIMATLFYNFVPSFSSSSVNLDNIAIQVPVVPHINKPNIIYVPTPINTPTQVIASKETIKTIENKRSDIDKKHTFVKATLKEKNYLIKNNLTKVQNAETNNSSQKQSVVFKEIEFKRIESK